MIHAGPLVGFQHYPPIHRLLAETHPAAIAVFLVQTVAVAWGLVATRRTRTRMLPSTGRWVLLLIGAAFVLTSATLSRSAATYAEELLFASFVQLAALGNIFLIVTSFPGDWLERAGALFDRILGPAGLERAEPGPVDRFAWVLAAWVAGLSALLALGSYQGHPHVPDELAYLLQSRYFADGRLSMSLPLVPEAFNVDLMTYQATRWFSPFSPGWPAILAVGAFLGVPWVVNPLLGGGSLLLAYVLLREFYPRRTARIALILLASSPWHLFMGMNLMSHMATLTCALAAAVCVARLRRDPRIRWAVLGGCFVGIVGLIRPLDGAAVALLVGLWSLGARGRRFRFAPSMTLTAMTIATGAMVLPYNRHLTGSGTAFPVSVYMDATFGAGRNDLGFGSNRGVGWPGLDPLPGHGPVDVAINANFNLFQINTELLGWATGSLFLLLVWLSSGRTRRSDWEMVAAAGMVAGIHSFYYFSGGPDFGARYWYLAIIPCLALTARGIEYLEGSAEGATPGAGRRVLLGAGVLALAAVLVFVPWRAADKYFHYRGMRPDIRRIPAEHRVGNGIVLVRGKRHPDYASAMAYNPVDFNAPRPLFAWDRGPDVRRKLAAAYPGRLFWIVAGPTLTGGGYRMIAGPLTGAELVARPDSLGSPP